jgi:ketosteroid isomerase-like protein
VSDNLALIRATYEGTAEQNGRNLLAVLAPDVEWTEAAGFPYAGVYVGPQAVAAQVFHRLATEWIDYRAVPHRYMADGDQVAVFGTYEGIYRATGRAMQASFAHLYTVQAGRITRMQQYVDSHMVRLAMTPA